jgi:hypothetical protein
MHAAHDATSQAGRRGLGAGAPLSPRVWPPVRRAVEVVFTGLAKLQRGRAFHPRGMAFEASIRPTELGVRVLPINEPGRALVRLSKGAGLPSRIPDVFGLGLRLPDAHGPDRHQDVLLSTAIGDPPVLRHLLLPTMGADRRRYSSLLPYRHRGRLVLLGARYAGPRRSAPLRIADLDDAARAGALAFDLAVARLYGPWRAIARVTLERRLPAAEAERLRFHPWNTSPQLPLVGPMSRLRVPAYEASHRAATSE